MYIEVRNKHINGIYKVKEIIGNIVCIDKDGVSFDCYLSSGEIKRFCTKDGKNSYFNSFLS